MNWRLAINQNYIIKIHVPSNQLCLINVKRTFIYKAVCHQYEYTLFYSLATSPLITLHVKKSLSADKRINMKILRSTMCSLITDNDFLRHANCFIKIQTSTR